MQLSTVQPNLRASNQPIQQPSPLPGNGQLRDYSLLKEFNMTEEAKAVEAAMNKDGQLSQVGRDLPVTGIIAPSGW